MINILRKGLQSRHLKMSFIVITSLMIICTMAYFITEKYENERHASYIDFPDLDYQSKEIKLHLLNNGIKRLSYLNEGPPKTKNRNIFFINMDLTDYGDYLPMLHLKSRFACAIESAALHNPNYDIYVVHPRPTFWNVWNADKLIDELFSYQNIHFQGIKFGSIIMQPTFLNWYRNGTFFKKRYCAEYIKAILSMIFLVEYGGIYLTDESIVLRNFRHLQSNFVVTFDNKMISGDMLGLREDFNNEFPYSCIHELHDSWGSKHIADKAITRVFKLFCGDKTLEWIMAYYSVSCGGLVLNYQDCFYKLRNRSYGELRYPLSSEDYIREALNSSIVLRMWDGYSNDKPIKIDTSTLLGDLVYKNCPKVFNVTHDHF